MFNGFWIVDFSSQEEAVQWAKRAPLDSGSQIEVRRINGPEDFPQDNEWIREEQEWTAEGDILRTVNEAPANVHPCFICN